MEGVIATAGWSEEPCPTNHEVVCRAAGHGACRAPRKRTRRVDAPEELRVRSVARERRRGSSGVAVVVAADQPVRGGDRRRGSAEPCIRDELLVNCSLDVELCSREPVAFVELGCDLNGLTGLEVNSPIVAVTDGRAAVAAGVVVNGRAGDLDVHSIVVERSEPVGARSWRDEVAGPAHREAVRLNHARSR